MQRVHRRRTQVYQDKDFQIQSLTSLVKLAKQKTCERIEGDLSDTKSIHLPLHDLTERLMESLQQMHHHLQGLLMQKLGPDARNVIAAERARQDRAEKEELEKKVKTGAKEDRRSADHIATHLSDVGRDGGDELELLNDYRQRYAAIMAELLVAKERLLQLEKGIEETVEETPWRRRISEDISELSGEDDDVKGKRKRIGRRRSTFSSGAGTSDEEPDPDSPSTSKWKSWT
jgi:hypothetical protein